MRSLVEILIGVFLLIGCLMIRWPTGELDPQRDAEAWVQLDEIKDVEPTMTARWEKMAENRVRLLTTVPDTSSDTRELSAPSSKSSSKPNLEPKPKSPSASAPGPSTEVAQATLTWSERVTFTSNARGDLLIGRGSQIWSRGPSHWRAWSVRDGWEIEAAKWVQVPDGGVWELQWRRTGAGPSPQSVGEVQVERRDRDLRKLQN